MDIKDNREYTKADAIEIIHPTHAQAFSAGLFSQIPIICKACLNVGLTSYKCNVGVNMNIVGPRFDKATFSTPLLQICSKFFAAVNR
ncbi:MAG TPA: hypothetical protein VJC17_04610 [Candidatus Dojkabacteria bacterium]|nr:hypothetical protein [Candidatus Dojkabacteria bacterium]